MKATVTQINPQTIESDWANLIEHIKANNSEFVLLPEMCFAPWFCAEETPDNAIWQAAVETHDRWLERLPELGAPIVMGTAPRNIDGKKYNTAFVWTPETGIQWGHQKTYLPEEDGYWEASWYDRAPIDFQPITINDMEIGVMICTELWFMQHAREYGQQGVHIIINPRCTTASGVDKWITGGRTAGVIAGAYSLSANRAGQLDGLKFGGAGWISDPDSVLLGVTSDDEPFITIDIDLAQADAAKADYPRYVDDSEL